MNSRHTKLDEQIKHIETKYSCSLKTLLKELYLEKRMTGVQIHETLGLKIPTTYLLLHRLNIQTRPFSAAGIERKRKMDQRIEQIERKYGSPFGTLLSSWYIDEKRTGDEIAERLNIPHQTMYDLLDKYGIQKRSTGECLKGRPCSEKTKVAVSRAQKGKRDGPLPEIQRRKIGEANKGRVVTGETRLKLSLTHKGKRLSPKSEFKLNHTTPKAWREAWAISMRKVWQNPDFVRKQMKARGVKPNKVERVLELILNEAYPGQWKYTGDGQFIIAGKCPDFVNVNGKKQIIEVYGDFWHRGQDPAERIDLFKQFGYSTLVVWEKEFTDMPSLKIRLDDFMLGANP